MTSPSIQVVIDCADPASLARFWAAALGYEVQPPPPGYDSWEAFLAEQGVPESAWNSRSAIVDPDGGGPRVFFQQVPEPKRVKNRVHLDIHVGTDLAPEELAQRRRDEVDRLVGLGATVAYELEELGVRWVTLTDPEGNEFCVS